MATALETPQAPAQTAASKSSLLSASLLGTAVLLVGFSIVNYAVPFAWDAALTPVLGKLGGFINSFLRVVVLLAATVGVVYAASKLLPANPPVGTRGGIFLSISTIIALFFIIRAVGLNVENGGAMGMGIFALVTAALLFGTFKLFTSNRYANTAVLLEEEGLFHTHSFKKTQGLRTRRWTFVALVGLGLSGVYAMMAHNVLPTGDWTSTVPFLTTETGANKVIRLLSDVNYTLPIILAGATAWFAWRAVNMTSFGDFLIGTDAEMNKVSWSTWKKLMQDTIVVLVTTALLTAFLLLIDLFWGWLLTDIVRVLPQHKPSMVQNVPGQNSDW